MKRERNHRPAVSERAKGQEEHCQTPQEGIETARVEEENGAQRPLR